MTEPHAQPYVVAGEDVQQPAVSVAASDEHMVAPAWEGPSSGCHQVTQGGKDMQGNCELSLSSANMLPAGDGGPESKGAECTGTSATTNPTTTTALHVMEEKPSVNHPCPIPPASSPEPGQQREPQIEGEGSLSSNMAPSPQRCENPSDKSFCDQLGGGGLVGKEMGAEGDEMEGGREWTPPSESPTPPYLRWAKSLGILLDDMDGVKLFQTFHEKENFGQIPLNFLFACKGLKKTPPDNVTSTVRLIYKRLMMHLPPNSLKESTRKEICAKVAAQEMLTADIFDEAEKEINILINNAIYPNFLRSEVYLGHIQSCQNGSEPSKSSDSSHNSSDLELPTGGGRLPTLHEDAELTSLSAPQSVALTLTRDTLLATQERRAYPWSGDGRPRVDAYAGHYLHHGRPPNPYHMTYAPYNPVSRQDSELQSLSSEAPTEDGSLNGTSGKRHCNKGPCRLGQKASKTKGPLIADPMASGPFIPRTSRLPEQQKRQMEPAEFVKEVTEKLLAVQRDRERSEKINSVLGPDEESAVGESCPMSVPMSLPMSLPMSVPHSQHSTEGMTRRVLAAVIKDKLPQGIVEDDQAILDKHVSRVWSETPSWSSGGLSPRPHSPEGMRRRSRCPAVSIPMGKGGGVFGPAHAPHATSCHPMDTVGVFNPYQARTAYSHHRRKEKVQKDVYSIFSSDSGNVRDFQDGSEQYFHIPKSKSMPDYGEVQNQELFPNCAGFDPSRRVGRDAMRKSVAKKVCNDLTDSGVSVISDTPPSVPFAADQKVRSWVMDAKKYKPQQYVDMEKESSKHRTRSSNATSPSTSRSSRKQTSAYSANSRSNSLERCSLGMIGVVGDGVPNQPMATDILMPRLPQPNTETQLLETRRRLEEDVLGKVVKPRTSSSVKPQHLETSNPSTLKKSRCSSGATCSRSLAPPHPSSGAAEAGDCTVVMYSFCDEEVPYRSRLPGKPVTLRQFKELLPKKGNYRFFFKTPCDEVDEKVIQEEVHEDNDILPLLDGKVFAVVKPAE